MGNNIITVYISTNLGSIKLEITRARERINHDYDDGLIHSMIT